MKKSILVENWKDGIGESSIQGFQNIQSMDVFNIDGIARVENKLTDITNYSKVVDSEFTGKEFQVIKTTLVVNSDSTINVDGIPTPLTQTGVVNLFGVFLTTTGAFPTISGYTLSVDKLYYLARGLNSSSNSYRLFRDLNSALNFSTNKSTTGYLVFTNTGSGTLNGYFPEAIGNVRSGKSSSGVALALLEYVSGGSSSGKTMLFAYGLNNGNGDVINRWIPISRWDANDGSFYNYNTEFSGIGEFFGYFILKSNGFLFCLSISQLSLGQVNYVKFLDSPNIDYNDSYDDVFIFQTLRGRLYFTTQNGKSLSFINSPNKNFDPNNASTFIANYNVFSTTKNETITCIEELSSDLYVGTNQDRIIVWDGVSILPNSFIPTTETYIYSILNFNNTIYYSAGVRGKIYKTLGVTSQLVFSFSEQLGDIPQSNVIIYSMINYNNRLLFTINGNNFGVYTLDLDENEGKYVMKNKLPYTDLPLTGTSTITKVINRINIKSKLIPLPPSNSVYSSSIPVLIFMSMEIIRRSTFGFTQLSPYSRQDISDNAYPEIISPLFEIGDDLNVANAELFYINLIQPLSKTGGYLAISFRANNSDEWSTEQIFSYGVIFGKNDTGISFNGKINLEKIKFIQFRLRIYSSSQAGFNTLSPLLKSVILTYDGK